MLFNGVERTVTNLHKSQNENTVVFVEHEIYNGTFLKLYSYGMALIEETAYYIDHDGRTASRAFSGDTASLYAAEAMQLSTRLMQVASWLLLARAERDKEMAKDQIELERAKISLNTPSQKSISAQWADLPTPFRDLVERSLRLEDRVRLMDYYMKNHQTPNIEKLNPVADQIEHIKENLTKF